MGLPSVGARILISKLKFLQKIAHGEDNLASKAFKSISVKDIESMSYIRQCHSWNLHSSNLMFAVLNCDDPLPASIKKTDLELDHSPVLSDADGDASQSFVLEVMKAGAWPKCWGNALDCGPKALNRLSNPPILRKNCYSDHLCSTRNCSFEVPKGSATCDHFI